MSSDEALYERLLDGDLTAFDALYERHHRVLFAFVFRQLNDAQAAEDVLHDTFLAVLNDGRAGRSIHALRAWLFQAARNLCLNRLRSTRREDRALEIEARRLGDEGVRPPDVPLEAAQAAALVRRAVDNLPAPLGELYRLRASGLSYDELAQVLQVPVGTVKSRLHEMVKRLREEMAT